MSVLSYLWLFGLFVKLILSIYFKVPYKKYDGVLINLGKMVRTIKGVTVFMICYVILTK